MARVTVRRVFKILIVALVGLYALGQFAAWAFVAGEIDYGSRGMPAYMSRSAEEWGMLIRRVPIATPVLAVRRDTMRLREAWVQRRSQIRYDWRLRPVRELLPGYLVCFTAERSRQLDAIEAIMGPVGYVELVVNGEELGVSRHDWSRDSTVFFTRTERLLSDSLRLGACEYKRWRDGPNPSPHDWLPACPQPLLDTVKATPRH